VNRFSLLLVLVVAMSLSASAAQARKKTKAKAARWVTMVLTHGDVPADWPTTLRKAAETGASDRTWLPPPGLSLDEVQLTLGCPTFDDACAGKAAALLDADNAVVIDVSIADTKATVSVESVSDEGAVVGATETVEVSADDAGRDVAAAWVKGVISGTKPTILIVNADLPDTEVLIDGAPVGVTPLTLVDTVSPGEHTLLMRREGRAPLQKTITVTAQTVNRETAALANGPPMKTEPTVGESTPAPITTTPAADGDSGSTMALVGYGVSGVGVVGAVVGGALAGINYARYSGVFFTNKNGVEATNPAGICSSDGGKSFGPKGSCGDGGADLDGDGVAAALDSGDLEAFRSSLSSGIAGGLVVAGAGLLVAATGIVLAIDSADGESADAAAGGEIQGAPAK
jgi:hypothetical protein